jgi:hypothetical protein
LKAAHCGPLLLGREEVAQGFWRSVLAPLRASSNSADVIGDGTLELDGLGQCRGHVRPFCQVDDVHPEEILMSRSELKPKSIGRVATLRASHGPKAADNALGCTAIL